MEAAIFGAVLSSTLPWLYKAIEKRSKKWGKSQGKLKLEVESIQSELELIRAAIKDYCNDNRSDMSNLRRTWIAQLRRLAFKIEDCIDNFRAEKISGEELAIMITNLNKSAEETHEKLQRYISEEPKKKTQSLDDTSSDPDHGVVLGMEEPLDELKALLWESLRSSERKLRVIFIVGFGGIGKTLLAEKIYREECNQFPRHAFVRMSGRDRKEVLNEIIEKLQKQETIEKSQQREVNSTRLSRITTLVSDLWLHHRQQDAQGEGVHGRNNPADLQEFRANGVHGDVSASTSQEASQEMRDIRRRLRSCLGSNRYLIVIDDIRAEELCNDIISSFPRQEEVDSRIIVTTTIQSVAQSCSSDSCHVYNLRPLNDELSRKLFVEVACGDQSPSYSSQQRLSEFQKKCNGVPLALVSIAQYCNGDLSRCEEAWRKLCKPGREYKLARMQQVLDHSYDSLSSLVLQDCLLYLCIFPWGYEIRKGALMRRWLAEGLALPEDGSCLVPSIDAAANNFKTLIDRNVIRSIQVGINGEVKTCQPPGVMLGYIISKSESENFVMLSCDDGTPNPQDIRRLSLQHTGPADNVRVLLEKDLANLRTLAVFDKGEEDGLSFAKCLLLRVLDMESCHSLKDCHLDEICKLLRLLKYLSLGAGITKVPRTIQKLKWLETLHMKKETVVTVPAEVLELPNLKHLIGKIELCKGDSGKNNLKKFLKEESKLQTVAGFVTRKVTGFPQLMGHMRSLRKVKIWCSCDASSENLSDLLQSIKEFLYKAECTPRIRHTLSVDFDRCTVLQYLNSVLHHGNLPDENHPGGLSTLKLRGVLNPVPAFVTNLRGITELCLSSVTISWDAIVAGVSNLKILEYLKLVADNNIEGDVAIKYDQYISLKRLCLVAEQSVPQVTIHPGALKHLVSLHLLCPVPHAHSAHQIRHLHSLKELSLHSEVAQAAWKEAARDHPNRPSIVFVNKP
ncbi:unnamed protein product [Urochloa decumbens]|uniref:Uncharacterized protein n=1 Tax=Urochloa decumbens TaxID=240449 RepID=A0ABC9AYY4_9POAL